MAGTTRERGRRSGRVVLTAMMTAAVATVGLSGSAGAGVGGPVAGSAFGASGDVNITFAGIHFVLPPTPLVTLPPAGGVVSDTAPSAFLGGGPAVILTTGPLTARTEGSTGTGIVTSSASATDIGPGPFTATSASSTCTQTPGGFSGSAQVVNGVVETSDTTTVAVPLNPAPNTVITGVVSSVGDTFEVIFNEQVLTPDSLTVNAVHMRLLGPNAVGDVYIGQSVCGADTSTALSCTTSTNPGGAVVNVCTVSDPDGIRSVVVRNTATNQQSAGLTLNCSDAPTPVKFRVPIGAKYRVIVVDCDSPRNRTIFTLRANGVVN